MKPTWWAIFPEKFWLWIASGLWFRFVWSRAFHADVWKGPEYERYIQAASKNWYWGERRAGRL